MAWNSNSVLYKDGNQTRHVTWHGKIRKFFVSFKQKKFLFIDDDVVRVRIHINHPTTWNLLNKRNFCKKFLTSYYNNKVYYFCVELNFLNGYFVCANVSTATLKKLYRFYFKGRKWYYRKEIWNIVGFNDRATWILFFNVSINIQRLYFIQFWLYGRKDRLRLH